MTLVEPLDLETWLVETFVGDQGLFFIISAVIITYLGIKFRLSTPIFIIMLITFLPIISYVMDITSWLLLFILIGTPIIYYWIRKITD